MPIVAYIHNEKRELSNFKSFHFQFIFSEEVFLSRTYLALLNFSTYLILNIETVLCESIND